MAYYVRDEPKWRQVDGLQERLCIGCQRWFPWTADHFNRHHKQVLRRSCRACDAANSARRRAEKSELYNERRRQIRWAAKLARMGKRVAVFGEIKPRIIRKSRVLPIAIPSIADLLGVGK